MSRKSKLRATLGRHLGGEGMADGCASESFRRRQETHPRDHFRNLAAMISAAVIHDDPQSVQVLYDISKGCRKGEVTTSQSPPAGNGEARATNPAKLIEKLRNAKSDWEAQAIQRELADAALRGPTGVVVYNLITPGLGSSVRSVRIRTARTMALCLSDKRGDCEAASILRKAGSNGDMLIRESVAIAFEEAARRGWMPGNEERELLEKYAGEKNGGSDMKACARRVLALPNFSRIRDAAMAVPKSPAQDTGTNNAAVENEKASAKDTIIMFGDLSFRATASDLRKYGNEEVADAFAALLGSMKRDRSGSEIERKPAVTALKIMLGSLSREEYAVPVMNWLFARATDCVWRNNFGSVSSMFQDHEHIMENRALLRSLAANYSGTPAAARACEVFQVMLDSARSRPRMHAGAVPGKQAMLGIEEAEAISSAYSLNLKNAAARDAASVALSSLANSDFSLFMELHRKTVSGEDAARMLGLLSAIRSKEVRSGTIGRIHELACAPSTRDAAMAALRDAITSADTKGPVASSTDAALDAYERIAGSIPLEKPESDWLERFGYDQRYQYNRTAAIFRKDSELKRRLKEEAEAKKASAESEETGDAAKHGGVSAPDSSAVPSQTDPMPAHQAAAGGQPSQTETGVTEAAKPVNIREEMIRKLTEPVTVTDYERVKTQVALEWRRLADDEPFAAKEVLAGMFSSTREGLSLQHRAGFIAKAIDGSEHAQAIVKGLLNHDEPKVRIGAALILRKVASFNEMSEGAIRERIGDLAYFPKRSEAEAALLSNIRNSNGWESMLIEIHNGMKTMEGNGRESLSRVLNSLLDAIRYLEANKP